MSNIIPRALGLRCLAFRNFRQFKSIHISSAQSSDAAVPKEETETEPIPRRTPKIDPFGIEDIDEKSSSFLVQGFYEHDYNKQKQGVAEGEEQEGGLPNQKKYDEWISKRAKIQQEDKIREKLGEQPESVRQTSFGNVRLDSDNVVEHDGQFDTLDISRMNPFAARKHFGGGEVRGEDAPSLTQKVVAAEFLKKFKQEVNEEKKEKRVIENPIGPRLVKRKTKEEIAQERFSELVLSKESVDNNKIPKIYQLPEYNNLTQGDMWSLLRHQIIFQNEYIVAISKPPGMPMHSPAIDCRHYVAQFHKKFAEFTKCETVYPIHRLDKETSGVLILAKDQRIAKYLTEKFASRQVEKKYLAITKGCPRVDEATIKIPIGQGVVGGSEKQRAVLKPDLRKYDIKTRQQDCKEAITHFKVISSIKEAAFLEVNLETGVKHQIRVHLGLGLGCPVIGDQKYSHRDRFAPQRLTPHILHLIKVRQSKVRYLPLHLHCNAMSFTLPDGVTESSEPVYVHATVPNYFKHTLRALGLKN